MIDFVFVVDSDLWITDTTYNRVINTIWRGVRRLRTVTRCIGLSSFWLALCLLLCGRLVISQHLVHPDTTVHHKHRAVLMLVRLVSVTQTVSHWRRPTIQQHLNATSSHILTSTWVLFHRALCFWQSFVNCIMGHFSFCMDSGIAQRLAETNLWTEQLLSTN